MELAAKVVGQTAVVVVETQISRAHLANAQLLLLETGGRHGVSVFLLAEQAKGDKKGVKSQVEATKTKIRNGP